MDNAVSYGILNGRPFGGVGFLWYKSFDRNIQVLSNDPAGRCLVIKLNINLRSILLFNVYFPCFELGAEYRSEITYYFRHCHAHRCYYFKWYKFSYKLY